MKYAVGLGLLALQFLTQICTSIAQYMPPKPTIRPLYPQGIHLSIPHEPGITLVAFHAKFNEDFYGLEAGTIAVDIVKTKNNQWTYEDRSTNLKIGDTIYLWIHVVYKGLGYNLLDQMLHVTAFYESDGSIHTSSIPAPTPPPLTIETRPADPNNNNTTCYRSSTVYNGLQSCIGQLLFEEHFNLLQTNKWRVLNEFTGSPDYEFVVYQDNEENVSVKDGELRIQPTLLEKSHNEQFIRSGNLILEHCTGRVGSEECERKGHGYQILPPVSSGLIDTKQSFSFLYGRVEIRAKLPQGDWIYPIIMLLPVNASYGSGYHSGELRIASAVGNRDLYSSANVTLDGRDLRAGAVVSPDGPVRQNTLSKKSSTHFWGDDYHVYELEWTPRTISVKVDGERFGEKNNPVAAYKSEVFRDSLIRWTTENAPFDKPFYVSIGVAVGGHGEFPDGSMSATSPKPWRNVETKALLNFFTAKDTWANTWTHEASTLKVDYVKVWAL